MWPSQLLSSNNAGDLGGQQANLIQWTILIGSLLTLILLIMLIIRKMLVSTASLPSYRWLLAKQTAIKPASQVGSIRGRLVQSNKECNCKHQPQFRHHSLAGLSGTQLLCDEASPIIQHHHQVGSISHQAACRAAAANQPGLASAAYQQYLVTEASGRHLLRCSADYAEAEYADLPAACSRQPSSTATHSSRGSAGQPGRSGFRKRQDDQGGFAVISDFTDYDALDGCARYDQPPSDEKGFVLTRDFIAQTTTSCNLDHRADLRENKVNSSKQGGSAKSEVEATRQDDSPSGSSSIASSLAGESMGSNGSVRSTTAPMLSSNAGSFEQQSPNDELTSANDLNSTPAGSTCVLICNPLSAGCSPASVGGGGGQLRHHHNKSINMVGACSQSGAQSQPSSPMVLNSFRPTNQPLARYKTPNRLVRPAPYQDKDDEDSEYAQPDACRPNNNKFVAGHKRRESCSANSKHLANKPNPPRQDQSVLELARTFESKGDCDNDERHFYEEIASQNR